MDSGSQEELRVYGIMQKLENRIYSESELKKIFEYKVPLRHTRLYKYLKAKVDKRTLVTEGFRILQGKLVTGEHLKGKKPILRGKYKITTVIDGVQFIYVEKGEEDGK